MRKLLLLLCLVPVACKNTPKEEGPLLTPEERAELEAFVDKKMAELPGQVRLSKAQRESAAPFAEAAAKKIFEAARQYHADPTPENLKRFSREMKKVRDQLSSDIQPLMTSSQRYTYMSVFDKVIQEIRHLDLKD